MGMMYASEEKRKSVLAVSEEIRLLHECYELLFDIENDGWVVRHSGAIEKLLPELRNRLFMKIPVSTEESIHFCCEECTTRMYVTRRFPDESYTNSLCTTCSTRYLIFWSNDYTQTTVYKP